MIAVAVEAYENLRAFWHTRQMDLSPCWVSTRVAASLEAERRLVRYEAERVGRFTIYQRGGAGAAYRLRWRAVDRHIVLDPERFSRAVGAR